MDFCPHCGAHIQDNVKRCPKCRKSIKKRAFVRSGIERKLWALPGAVALIIVNISIVCIVVASAVYPRLSGQEPEYTEIEFFDCSKAGETAYVDIVDIIPTINVYSGEEITNLLCKCTATNGETVTLYITVSDFADNFDSDMWAYRGSSYEDVISFTARRVHGISVYHGDIIKDAPRSVAKNMLLKFVSAD